MGHSHGRADDRSGSVPAHRYQRSRVHAFQRRDALHHQDALQPPRQIRARAWRHLAVPSGMHRACRHARHGQHRGRGACRGHGRPGRYLLAVVERARGHGHQILRGHLVGGLSNPQRARRDRGRPHVLHLARLRRFLARGALCHLRLLGIVRHRCERTG